LHFGPQVQVWARALGLHGTSEADGGAATGAPSGSMHGT
jgi:hypothetical protein